jgi:hypothetical protein
MINLHYGMVGYGTDQVKAVIRSRLSWAEEPEADLALKQVGSTPNLPGEVRLPSLTVLLGTDNTVLAS